MNVVGVEVFDILSLLIVSFLVGLRLWLRLWTERRRTPAAIAAETLIVLALAAEYFEQVLEWWKIARTNQLHKVHGDVDVTPFLMDVTYRKLYFADGLIYTLFLWMIKGSFIAMYFEMFKHMRVRQKIGLYLVSAFVIVTFVASMFLKFFWCRPLKLNWIETDDPNQCNIDIALPVNTMTTVLNIATDISLLGLFLIIIYTLQIRNRELVGAIFVVAIGTCTIVASAVRYAMIFKVIQGSQNSAENLDLFLVWTFVEERLFTVAACLPAFRSFVRRRSSGSFSVRQYFSNRTRTDWTKQSGDHTWQAAAATATPSDTMALEEAITVTHDFSVRTLSRNNSMESRQQLWDESTVTPAMKK